MLHNNNIILPVSLSLPARCGVAARPPAACAPSLPLAVPVPLAQAPHGVLPLLRTASFGFDCDLDAGIDGVDGCDLDGVDLDGVDLDGPYSGSDSEAGGTDDAMAADSVLPVALPLASPKALPPTSPHARAAAHAYAYAYARAPAVVRPRSGADLDDTRSHASGKRRRLGPAPSWASEDDSLACDMLLPLSVAPAAFARAPAPAAATHVHSMPDVVSAQHERHQRLAKAKKNGNYDSYVRAAFDDVTVSLQQSLVGTPANPGFLVALQSTDGRGVTDPCLRDTPGGTSKSVLFLRTILYRVLRCDQVPKDDVFRTLVSTPAAFETYLHGMPSDAQRAQHMVAHLVRLVRLVRPHEAFHLPESFVRGVAGHASVHNYMKLVCGTCHKVQTWRKCRKCNKKSRARGRKPARARRPPAAAAIIVAAPAPFASLDAAL